VEQKRLNFSVIGNLAIDTFQESFNERAWDYHKGKGLTWSTGEAEKAILRGAEFDFLLLML